MTDAPERIWIEVCADLVEALEVENQRLREALTTIRDKRHACYRAADCQAVARAALSGEGET